MYPLRPCCQGINGGFCGSVDSDGAPLYTVCSSPKKTLFWDSVHPSNSGWKKISQTLFNWGWASYTYWKNVWRICSCYLCFLMNSPMYACHSWYLCFLMNSPKVASRELYTPIYTIINYTFSIKWAFSCNPKHIEASAYAYGVHHCLKKGISHAKLCGFWKTHVS